jgi:glucokinase
MPVPRSIEILPAAAADKALICAVDLGGTYLRAATIDSHGRLTNRLKLRTPTTDDPQEIVQVLACALRKYQRESDQIRALSMVVPGQVDARAGKVVRAPNLPCLNGFDLTEALAEDLQLPVIIENDANAAALGELWRGAGRGFSTIICLTLGTGVGGGMILDGKLWRGANHAAAEIGHMSVEPFGGVACGCGSRGCLEVYACATAIVRMAREAKPRYPTSSISAGDDLTAEDVYRSAKQGDELAIEVFHRVSAYLGIGLANLVNILNPEMIVIGGGVANAWDLLESEVRQQVNDRAFPLPAATVKIVPAQCNDDAGLLGAARLAFWEQSESEVLLSVSSG